MGKNILGKAQILKEEFLTAIKGVTRYKAKEYIRWRARICLNKKEIWIGHYFRTELEAAIAYDQYVKENNLPNPLNFPNQ